MPPPHPPQHGFQQDVSARSRERAAVLGQVGDNLQFHARWKRSSVLERRHGARTPLNTRHEELGGRGTVWDICASPYEPVPLSITTVGGKGCRQGLYAGASAATPPNRLFGPPLGSAKVQREGGLRRVSTTHPLHLLTASSSPHAPTGDRRAAPGKRPQHGAGGWDGCATAGPQSPWSSGVWAPKLRVCGSSFGGGGTFGLGAGAQAATPTLPTLAPAIATPHR